MKRTTKVLLSLMVTMAMMLTLSPTSVFATDAKDIIGDDIAIGDILIPGDVIHDKDKSGKQAFYQLGYYDQSMTQIKTINYDSTTFPYTVENMEEGTVWEVVGVIGKLDGYHTIQLKKRELKLVSINEGSSDKNNPMEGEIVTITANRPATGKQFKEWTIVYGDVVLTNSKESTTTFIMPDENVEITATYEDIVIPPILEEPTITAGAGSTHQINNGKDMTFTCSGKLEDLTGVYVDGKLVAENNYTLKSGSTILTLKTSYLDTLSTGKHTLKFQYKDNMSTETDFTITTNAGKTPTKPSSPKTGDTSITMLYLGLIVVSGCVASFGLKKKKYLNK